MRKLLFIALILGTTNLFAQQQKDSAMAETFRILQERVNQQQTDIQKLYSELDKEYRTYRIIREELNKTIIDKQVEIIDSLNTLIEGSNQQLNLINEELNSNIRETEQRSNTQIAQLDSSIEQNRLYWIIAILATCLLACMIYWILTKRITSSKSDVETQITNSKADVETQIRIAKASLEEKSVKLDNKLVEVLETQLKLQQETAKSQHINSNGMADHSLALKVADEIIRIQKNLSRMDESTKGLKQLNSSVKRIQDNFAANGYELVEMLNKDYSEGMKATVNFVQDEDLEEGKRIITRIIKPQVNYEGRMIQTAQIEVTEA